MFNQKQKTKQHVMKGQAENLVLSLVLGGILLIVGVSVISSTFSAMPVLTGAANTTATNIVTTTFSAFNLGTVVLIVSAAGAIIGALFLFMRR